MDEDDSIDWKTWAGGRGWVGAVIVCLSSEVVGVGKAVVVAVESVFEVDMIVNRCRVIL